jgi:Tfp pilus assembly protein PilO
MIVIVVAASVAIVGLWYVALFSPQSKSIQKANSEAATANIQADSLRSQIAVLQQEKLQLPASTAKLATLKAALPDTPALDKLIDDINGAANQAGVDWQTISPTKPASYTSGATQTSSGGFAGGMQSVTVTLQVNGTNHQILDFVTKLSGISRLIDVTSFNLSNSSGPRSGGQLTTQIFFVPSVAGAVPPTTTPVTP